jgi:hypothetical protein
MKKFIVLFAIVALLIPAVAKAQTQFTLGGFIKLDSFWDSTQTTKNMLTPILRTNDPNFNHGRVKFTAQGSRFNFTLKGPKLWGADVTGFIEMDFDSEQELSTGSANADSSSNNYKPRLRHAFFRLNWPDTELVFGQYWSMFCEYYPESAQDGPFMGHGMATARLPQIRLTQKFAGAWTVAALLGSANPITRTNAWVYGSTNAGAVSGGNTGQSGEMPQFQGKIAFEQDLYGKAAFYGRPKAFTAQVTAGVQRNAMRNNNQQNIAAFTWGDNDYSAAFNIRQKSTQYVYPWMAQFNLFVPVLTTTTANLAGTASLSFQAYMGQGLQAFGEAGGAESSYWKFTGRDRFGTAFWNAYLTKRYGGYLQAQYYFTNEWFVSTVYGFSKAWGVPNSRTVDSPAPWQQDYANTMDASNLWYEIDACLWYRPIQAIKFGLQYAYNRTDYFQRQSAWNNAQAARTGQNVSAKGESHRVEFVAFYFF